jgi:molybdopterin-guanine dinucleotide biosynthesis protein A
MSPPSPRDSALDATAIVLAGGLSTRLGRDKASEPLLGVPLLARVVERVAADRWEA